MVGQGFATRLSARAQAQSLRALWAAWVGAAALFAFGCASAPSTPPDDPSASASHDASGDTPVSSPPSSPASPDIAPAPQCSPTQYVGAGDRCFDTSQAACASLPCGPSDCLIQETAPARARCR